MSRAGRTNQSVSLFPFLAVLVCAMGALIFLLLVTTRRIRSDALERAVQAEAAETVASGVHAPAATEPVLDRQTRPRAPLVEWRPRPQQPTAARQTPRPSSSPEAPRVPLSVAGAMPLPATPLEQAIAVERLTPPQTVDQSEKRRAQFHSAQTLKQATLTALAERQALWQRLKDEQAKLKTQMETLAAEAEALARKRDELLAQQQSIRQAGGSLIKRIQDAERELEQKRQQVQAAQSKYSILPFDGQSGTVRRPILIECVEDGFRFLPENIELSAADFDGFVPEYNPLLAGTRALVDYWSKQQRQTPDDEYGEPYVLLVVRPSGTIGYYAARRLLHELGTDFGYELIEEDADLELPDSTPGAAEACRQAIQALAAHRAEIIANVQKSRSNLFADPRERELKPGERRIRLTPNGGVVVEEGAAGDGANGRGTGSARRTEPGRGAGRDADSRRGFPGLTRDAGVGEFARKGQGGQTPRSASGATPQVAGPARTQTDGSYVAGSAASRATPQQEPDPLAPFFGQDQEAPAAGPQAGRFESGHSRTMTGLGQGRSGGSSDRTGFGADRSTVGDASAGPSGRNGNLASGAPDAGGLAQSPTQASVGPAGDPAVPGRLGSQGRAEPTPGSGSHDHSGTPQIVSHGGGATQSQAAQRNGSATTSPGAASRPHAPQRSFPESTVSGGHSPSDSFANRARDGRYTSSGSAPRSNQSRAPSGQGGAAGGPGQASLSFGGRSSGEWRDVGRPRQRTWGIVGRGGTIGFEREVTVYVTDNVFRVGRYAVPASSAHRTQTVTQNLIDALDSHAQSWGPPPDNFYWVPAVQFVVSPGGESNYERVRGAIQRLGLTSNMTPAQPATSSSSAATRNARE